MDGPTRSGQNIPRGRVTSTSRCGQKAKLSSNSTDGFCRNLIYRPSRNLASHVLVIILPACIPENHRKTAEIKGKGSNNHEACFRNLDVTLREAERIVCPLDDITQEDGAFFPGPLHVQYFLGDCPRPINLIVLILRESGSAECVVGNHENRPSQQCIHICHKKVLSMSAVRLL